MTGFTATRVISFVLVGVSIAFCQRAGKPSPLRSLPDAPLPQTGIATSSADTPSKRAFLDTRRLSLDTATAAAGLHFDQGHFDVDPTPAPSYGASEDKTAQLFRPSPRFHFSNSDSLFGRATDAAASIVLPRDENGNRHLNTSYLLRVLTAAAAHSAYRPYWRRSISQPISDVGSTVGNDAGMNVFHEFEPGILQLVKTHQPRFVAKIGEHFSHK